MNWNAVGAIGQILGSLATFVTVGYLVIQVHDTERDMKRSIAQSRAERLMQLNLAGTDERLVAIHVKGNLHLLDQRHLPMRAPAPLEAFTNQAGLTYEEAGVLIAEQSASWNNLSQTVLYVDELAPGDREQFNRTTRGHFSEPLVRLWYETAKRDFNPDVVRYVDNLLATPTG